MSSIQRTLRLVCFASVLFGLIANLSLLKADAAIKRQAKAHKRDRAERSAKRSDARRRGSFSARQTRAPGRRQTSAAERRGGQRLTLTKRQRASEMRRIEVRRRAEAARLAHQRALDEAMRDEVQSLIAKDATAGEDLQVRRVAINALGRHAGTVVVMDPETGRVYSIVNQEWALREGFKPCSTIKLVTGLAGLNEKVIDLIDTANISATNQTNLTRALAYSKNGYFQQVGGRVGFDKMVSYARQLGLGEKTGINTRNEFPGRLPAPKSGFAVNHMSSHGDDFKVTALQLATLVSAMANGGKLLTPDVARTPKEEVGVKPRVRRLVDFDPNLWHYMIPGMVGAVNYGSGKRAYDPAQTIAGKTGTCIEQGTWVGLFASYAPLADPRLAVVVIARGLDARSHFPAGVAGRIYRDLNSRFGMPTPTNLQIAATPDSNAPTNGPRVDRAPKVTLNEEEKDEVAAEGDEADEATDDGATNGPGSPAKSTATAWTTKALKTNASTAPKTLWRKTGIAAHSKVRRVLMQIPRRTEEATKPAVPSMTAPGRDHKARNRLDGRAYSRLLKN